VVLSAMVDRRAAIEARLAQVERHCTASSGGSFIPGPSRAQLFAATVAAFSTELVSAPAPSVTAGASDLDLLLFRTAHRMVRRQVSLNHSWFESTKKALGEALQLADDEEGLKVESAMAEVIAVVSLAAGVYVYWIAIQGEYRPASKDSGTTAVVSEEQWKQLRGLSPSCFAAPNTALLPPFGPGDNGATGGNRLHAVSRGVPGRMLPKDVVDFGEYSSIPGMKGHPFRCCTLCPGDLAALLAFVSVCYTPMDKFLTLGGRLPGRDLTRPELEVVAGAAAGVLACTF